MTKRQNERGREKSKKSKQSKKNNRSLCQRRTSSYRHTCTCLTNKNHRSIEPVANHECSDATKVQKRKYPWECSVLVCTGGTERDSNSQCLVNGDL
jgi:hypothetical protein